mmetsp:Transcript_33088/g.55419  ORF Transcript_33088/g.55419 Transcript_33088/m.55419 type:complete len:309 (+) Transcript_33088:275-1201(+)|eukprot:CAMPEP_0198207218 /NCGR_PEP_ID=MMETSP1445-20131203/10696_1 /TAXON_ID=36898 /ORGANISM="Pyramimonas sp., Strain CCMP2087" /LENGTH=308 /DNA_ID=CAMNT_0043880181 /DNA_START=214 /DNA_END=1140 /DNA_ORIENTATION=-
MGCAISKRTYAKGVVRDAQAKVCDSTPQAQHQEKSLEKPQIVKRRVLNDSADGANDSYSYNHPAGRHSSATSSSSGEEADVLTNDCADPYETCNTQTDDEPKENEASKTELGTFGTNNQPKENEDETELSKLKRRARASRRRARMDQKKVDLEVKRAHDKEVAVQHATLCENYDNNVRLDKVKQTKKEEAKYRALRNASKERIPLISIEDADGSTSGSSLKCTTEAGGGWSRNTAVAQANQEAPPGGVRASMDQLSRDLGRRATLASQEGGGSTHVLLPAGERIMRTSSNKRDFSAYIKRKLEKNKTK